jgi:hypothetical protein
MMSAGRRSGGGGFSRGGSSSKPAKRRKQDYHERKLRLPPEESALDFQTLRQRTVQSLDRLGHQLLPFDLAYGMDNWLKSLNFLLDDFEAKAANWAVLPPSYAAARSDALATFAAPPTFPELEAAIGEARDSRRRAVLAIGDHDSSYFGSRLGGLRAKREGLTSELASERRLLADARSNRRPDGLLKKLFGRGPTPTEDHESKVSALEGQVAKVDSDIAATEADEAQFKEAKEKLGQAVDKVAELEAKKLERMQLTLERQEATKKLAEAISSLA